MVMKISIFFRIMVQNREPEIFLNLHAYPILEPIGWTMWIHLEEQEDALKKTFQYSNNKMQN